MVAREQVRVELRRLDNSTLSVRDPQSSESLAQSTSFVRLPCTDNVHVDRPRRANASRRSGRTGSWTAAMASASDCSIQVDVNPTRLQLTRQQHLPCSLTVQFDVDDTGKIRGQLHPLRIKGTDVAP